MNIFNSLGSSYDLPYVLKSLSGGNSYDKEKLNKLLEKRYGGKAILLYKGREALSLALKTLNLPDDSQIAINGFTCVAVFNAIRKAGFEPVCLDLALPAGRQEETSGLNFTAKTLENAVRENKKIKVVVVQNTLGYPCDIEGIQDICRKNKLILIEDLAHCVGTHYENGEEAGTVGDFVILSFSQDKIIDAVSGGAFVVRNKKYQKLIEGPEPKSPPVVNLVKDRLYPLETYKIRFSYKFGFGKPYHFLLKSLNLLPDVMNESFYEYYVLPNRHASLALYQFESLEKQLSHRRKIAEVYVSELPDILFMFDKKKTLENVSLSSNLRFPIFIDNNRSGLIKALKKNGVYVSDIWYTDVAPECPNALRDSKIILNLPTHINVSESDAKKIAKLVNQWIQR